jgi:hypothetical protein
MGKRYGGSVRSASSLPYLKPPDDTPPFDVTSRAASEFPKKQSAATMITAMMLLFLLMAISSHPLFSFVLRHFRSFSFPSARHVESPPSPNK